MLDLIFIVLGLIGLFYGADFLVKGAARLAGSFGIPALVIGLTVVSYGTSMPEQIVSLTAAFQEKSDIAVGNVVGSNIFNIAFILGVTGLIFPVNVHAQLIKREIPIMIGVSFLIYAMSLNGKIEVWEGVLLFAGIIIFTVVSYWMANHEKKEVADEAQEFDEIQDLLVPNVNRLLETGRTLLGVIILMIAAQLTVEGSVGLAKSFGISDAVIGLTLVAAGTSLPELATSVVAAFRKESDIAIGNVVGSNIFNILSILGLTSIILPINVADNYLQYDIPIMIAIAILLLPVAWNRKIGRGEGAMFLGIYVAYTIFLFVR